MGSWEVFIIDELCVLLCVIKVTISTESMSV